MSFLFCFNVTTNQQLSLFESEGIVKVFYYPAEEKLTYIMKMGLQRNKFEPFKEKEGMTQAKLKKCVKSMLYLCLF